MTRYAKRMSKIHSVPADVKRQILDQIKEGGVSITQIAQEHGISSRTIYGWLSKGATAAPSWLELNKKWWLTPNSLVALNV